MERAIAAISIAQEDAPKIDKSDAAVWVESMPKNQPGRVRVLMHSICFQYFPTAIQERIEKHMEKLGELATQDSPLAWLSFEQGGNGGPELRLKLWPPGSDQVLARADAHCRKITWF